MPEILRRVDAGVTAMGPAQRRATAALRRVLGVADNLGMQSLQVLRAGDDVPSPLTEGEVVISKRGAVPPVSRPSRP